MPVPVFSVGETLTSAAMNAVGLWRITTCTASFAGGTAGSVSNGVITVGTNNTSITVNNAFSADYDSYKIIYTGGVGSTSPIAIAVKMGTTATGYYASTLYFSYTGTAGTSAFGVPDNNSTRWLYVGSANTTAAKLSMEVYSPFLATRTTFAAGYNEFGTANAGHSSGYLNNDTSYTSFTLETSTGSLTGGKIRIYGYRN